jgi:hemerythrin
MGKAQAFRTRVAEGIINMAYLIDPDNPQYQLGLPDMDQTHREFIAIVNRCQGLNKADFMALFDELFEHTREHFASEKRLMEESGFPAIREHDDEHRRVLGELDQLRRRMIERDSTTSARTYVELGLPMWFALHAATMDSALAAHLKRQSPVAAQA